MTVAQRGTIGDACLPPQPHPKGQASSILHRHQVAQERGCAPISSLPSRIWMAVARCERDLWHGGRRLIPRSVLGPSSFALGWLLIATYLIGPLFRLFLPARDTAGLAWPPAGPWDGQQANNNMDNAIQTWPPWHRRLSHGSPKMVKRPCHGVIRTPSSSN